MVEMIAQGHFNQTRRFRTGEPILGLTLELRFADENRQHRRNGAEQIFRRHIGSTLFLFEFAIGAQAFDQRRTKARFMRAALRGWDGIGVGVQKPIAAFHPTRRPFNASRTFGKFCLARPGSGHHGGAAFQSGGQEIRKPAREMQHGLRRCFILDQRGIASPADFNTAIQIRLGSAEAIKPFRAKHMLRKNLRVRLEANGRAAPVLHRAGILQLRDCLAARIDLGEQRPVTRDLNLHPLRQCVHDR